MIRNEQAADSMMSYQSLVETINTNQGDDRIERRAADLVLSRMFNPFVFDQMVTIEGVNRPANNPPQGHTTWLSNKISPIMYIIGRGSNFILQSRLAL
ncbi:MAG: hypothetical protein IPQ25_10930 [Chitinophagaceae bacterium]|nr:hypothetical protein [Chitinophagaceae bacterium]